VNERGHREGERGTEESAKQPQELVNLVSHLHSDVRCGYADQEAGEVFQPGSRCGLFLHAAEDPAFNDLVGREDHDRVGANQVNAKANFHDDDDDVVSWEHFSDNWLVEVGAIGQVAELTEDEEETRESDDGPHQERLEPLGAVARLHNRHHKADALEGVDAEAHRVQPAIVVEDLKVGAQTVLLGDHSDAEDANDDEGE